MSSKETGIVVLGTGVSILILGAMLLFDKALVIAGHLLILAGFVILLRSNTFVLFQPDKLQGTCFFILGLAVLFFKYQLLGFLLELVGIFLIFKASIPSFKTIFLKLFFKSQKHAN